MEKNASSLILLSMQTKDYELDSLLTIHTGVVSTPTSQQPFSMVDCLPAIAVTTTICT